MPNPSSLQRRPCASGAKKFWNMFSTMRPNWSSTDSGRYLANGLGPVLIRFMRDLVYVF